MKPGTPVVPDNQKYTVFASIDAGTAGVDISTITQNQNRLKQVSQTIVILSMSFGCKYLSD